MQSRREASFMGGQEPGKVKKHICTGLLAHVDAGKTTLSEAILYGAGAIRRLGRVDDRDAFLDTYELERARGITIFSKQAVCSMGDMEVTLMDTPGHVDFSAEMERTLQILDYAVLLINGADGIQGHTETLWRLLKRYQIPTILFVNKMDQPGTDRIRLMAELKNRLDEACVDFGGWQAEGGDWNPAADEKEAFAENLAVCDEAVLESYLETGTVKQEEIIRLTAGRRLFPVFFGSALKLKGIETFLRGFSEIVQAPEHSSAFGAKIYKISRDSQGNRLTHLKVTGGTLRVKDVLAGEEKVNQIRIYSGSKYETVQEAQAGTVCAVTGLISSAPGQGLGAEASSELPVLEPVLNYRILLPEGADVHKSLRDLRQLEEEEPELHILWEEATGEINVQVMGDVQIEILKTLIRERFGFEAEFGTGNIVYKETILEPSEGVGHFEPLRHYAEVHLLLEPGEAGSGLQFDTVCSEDVLDRNWQRLVLTHLEEKRHRGVLTGAEITDMRITLLTGRAHIKHTEGGDFRQATYRALRQGLRSGRCRLLEPYYGFRMEIPAENLGRAMADIERKKGVFDPPETEGDMAVLTGKGPVVNLRDYQREVTAYTKGRGRLSLWYKDYEPCHNEEEVILQAGYDPEADLENPTGSVFCSHGAGFAVPWDQVENYMHLESPLKKDREEKGEVQTGESFSAPAGGGADGAAFGYTGGSWSGDRELEAIFERTFGPVRRKNPGQEGPKSRVYTSEKKKKPEEKKEEETEYLLVDGYNIIFAWEELRELSKTTIEGARHRLMDILCNYQGYKKCTLILVFDAYKVSGNTGEALDYHNIHVVYTKEAETADQYIEKLAHRIGRRYRVTVATSDGLEQLIIYGQGCHLMSAKDLKEDIEWTNHLIREEKERLETSGRHYLFQGADQELNVYLEEVRLGRKKIEPEG